MTWHAECHPDWIAQQALNGATTIGAADAFRSNSRREREQGPLFDAVDIQGNAGEAMVTPPIHTHTPISANANGFMAGFADALAPYLNDRLSGLVDEEQVRAIIEHALQGAILKTVTTVDICNHVTGEFSNTGLCHSLYPRLLQMSQARTQDGGHLNIWLAGPAGSGKTTAAGRVAKDLALPFAFTGALDNPYGLLGFIDAQGGYRRTPFREIYEHGGVFLFDEIDGSTPSAILPFNAALANGHCMFPDAMVAKHKDCIIIAAANTWGSGATSDYVGRMKLDAASLDRFVKLFWTVDEGLELATVGNSEWVERVQFLRAKAKAIGLKVLITPRASYFGASLLATGMLVADVEQHAIAASMTADQWGAISC